MRILLRLIKVLLAICLIPFMFITLILAYFIIFPIVMIINLFKYVFTGNGGILDKYLFDDGIFTFEGLSFGWAVCLSEWYDKKFLKKL